MCVRGLFEHGVIAIIAPYTYGMMKEMAYCNIIYANRRGWIVAAKKLLGQGTSTINSGNCPNLPKKTFKNVNLWS